MTDRAKKTTFNFTQSFKTTVQRFDSLSDGKKADFSRSMVKTQKRSATGAKSGAKSGAKPAKVAS
ncbi:hypothetical protein [Roseovarius sp.]|uniref:hypothetical protein n=1 Tax=Roseovarius sp. TaxID=1486281 RepID=UPI00356467A5